METGHINALLKENIYIIVPLNLRPILLDIILAQLHVFTSDDVQHRPCWVFETPTFAVDRGSRQGQRRCTLPGLYTE